MISKLKMYNGAGIAPCIISKAQFALGLKNGANNNKVCSKEYWDEVVDIVGNFKNVSRRAIIQAKAMYSALAQK